ncbi:MAG TPA: MOSC domain-containing protein [Micropepsaceae bacterium]|jgi:MOSC domain-containing protein YiiM
MGRIIAVSRSAAHSFSKPNEPMIQLVAGLGVADDAHLGETVQHLARVREDPTKPNLRQVHLIHCELFDELREAGFSVAPGEIGENVTTRGIDLLGLPAGTRLHLGESAVVQVTGLRNPCRQLDRFQPGLMAAMLGRDGQGRITLKSGIMGIVLAGGHVRAGDSIAVALPPEPHRPMTRV